jgi:imidazolonepropionase-like amidohydrolase
MIKFPSLGAMAMFGYRWLFFLLAFALVAEGPASAQNPENVPKLIAIRAGRLIDGQGGAPVRDAVILIEDDKIKSIDPKAVIPAGAEIIDLSQSTVLPGLIDCHTHVTMQPSDYYERLFRRSPIDAAVMVHVYAQRTLEAGFTTIRDLGAEEFVDVALRNAIERGEIPGPRLQVATLALGSTGGHNDLSGFSPYIKFTTFSGVADGVDEIRKLIRVEIKNGADVIKMIASAGVLSEEEAVGAPQYSQEEMKAVVEEAAMWGRKVAAHAHGSEAIKRALRAGVRSIEHASLIDDEGLAMAKERGTWLVMDIYNDDYILEQYKKLGYPQKVLDKEAKIGHLQRENFRKAVQAGVKLAFGTDAGVFPHGWNGRQFAKMVACGMTPMQAIQSATTSAAELLGWSDRIGSVAPGRFADIIAVNGDPLTDISELERVAFAMKGGVVYKSSPAK